MIDKNQIITFKNNSLEVELTEFPFYPGEEFHVSIEALSGFGRVTIWGNPEEEQTLSLVLDNDTLVFIKGENLFSLLKDAVKEYEKTWKK